MLLAAAGVVVVVVLAGSLGSYQKYQLDMLLLTAAAAVALNLVMGCAGLVSIGTAAFLAVGAFSSLVASQWGWPFPLNLVFGAGVGVLIGLLVGLPALRIKGLYLALATLAAHFIIMYVAQRFQTVQVGSTGFIVPPLEGPLGTGTGWTLLCAATLAGCVLLVHRLSTGSTGRAWRMVRDHEPAAGILGIESSGFKLIAFMISSGLICIVGGMMAQYDGVVSVDNYGLNLAIAYMAMLVIGGLDSIMGAIVGAVIVTMLPQALPWLAKLVFGESAATAMLSSQLSAMVYGALIVAFVVFAPRGLTGLLRKSADRAGERA